MKKLVEMVEIWQPTKKGKGEIVSFGRGKDLKLVAKLINGVPIFLKKDWIVERRWLTKEEEEHLTH